MPKPQDIKTALLLRLILIFDHSFFRRRFGFTWSLMNVKRCLSRQAEYTWPFKSKGQIWLSNPPKMEWDINDLKISVTKNSLSQALMNNMGWSKILLTETQFLTNTSLLSPTPCLTFVGVLCSIHAWKSSTTHGSLIYLSEAAQKLCEHRPQFEQDIRQVAPKCVVHLTSLHST